MRPIFFVPVIAIAMAAATSFYTASGNEELRAFHNISAAKEQGPEGGAHGDLRAPSAKNATQFKGAAFGKAWIVAGVLLPDGNPAFMTFQVPDAPELTMSECEEMLPSVVTTLKSQISQMTSDSNTKLQNVKCIWSVTDPIKPVKQITY